MINAMTESTAKQPARRGRIFQNALYHQKNLLDAKLKMKYFIGAVGQFLSVYVQNISKKTMAGILQ